MLGVRQKTGQQQNSFARQRQSNTLQYQHGRHGPVSVVHQHAAQQVENVMVHHLGTANSALSGGKLFSRQVFNESAIEFLRASLVRQMSNPREYNQRAIGKIFRSE